MRIAVLGATSQIAGDLVRTLSRKDDYGFLLYARRPDAVTHWLADQPELARRCSVAPLNEYGKEPHGAVIHAIGSGDPSKTARLGSSFVETTAQFDQQILDHLQANPATRYIFLSSGAVYGGDFAKPADADTPLFPLSSHEYYARAKREAEGRHRALRDLAIIDLRIFSYFSRTQDIQARYFITDALRALQNNHLFQTLPSEMMRDYAHPEDIAQLVEKILHAPAMNAALDCYSKAPISKHALLESLKERYGLQYEFAASANASPNATGLKPHYYSLNHAAEALGYTPDYSSEEGILRELAYLL